MSFYVNVTTKCVCGKVEVVAAELIHPSKYVAEEFSGSYQEEDFFAVDFIPSPEGWFSNTYCSIGCRKL